MIFLIFLLQISTCVGLQALAKAYTKYSQGLRYTGVSLVACGRSEMILPVGVGNLQKGERYVALLFSTFQSSHLFFSYANMDYTFGSAIHLCLLPLILISYDIACQWFVNLFKRMNEHWPDKIKPNPNTDFLPAIPKLHEPMHGKANHQMYSLNYIPGVGNSDCKVPKRIWAPHNALGNSTKTQGPGSRHDVIDDHFAFWNWLKKASLGTTLMKRYKAAVAERNTQAEGHRGLTSSLDPTQVKVWETMCITWEEAIYPKKGVKNPYQMDGLSEYSLTFQDTYFSKLINVPLRSDDRNASPKRVTSRRGRSTNTRWRIFTRHQRIGFYHAWIRLRRCAVSRRTHFCRDPMLINL